MALPLPAPGGNAFSAGGGAAPQLPPLGMVAPFLLAAPIALVIGAAMVFGLTDTMFIAVNLPRVVAITHAIVLGAVTMMMMGATYQLGPVVLGGQLLSIRLARVQFVVHILGLSLFIWALSRWDVSWMSIAGSTLLVSFILYITNIASALSRAGSPSPVRRYLLASIGFLGLAGAFGLTWVGALEHSWFPVTLGRLAAHAHIGLVGWLALTLMGVSYQLVPMFGIAHHVDPRFRQAALWVTAAATVTFATGMLFDPPAPLRLTLAAFLAAGPLLWSLDMWRFVLGRSRRRLDIQGRATAISLAFLTLTVVLGLGAAIGTPFTPDNEMARWPLAYAVAGVLGWAGTAALGNGIKIHAFLVWMHRYQRKVGSAPVPMIADLYDARIAHLTLALHTIASSTLVLGCVIGNLQLVHVGAAILIAATSLYLLTLLSMYRPMHIHPRTAPVGTVAS